MENVNCNYCKSMFYDDRSPEMCANKEARKYFENLRPNTHVISYCADFNKHNNCEFYKPNLRGLIKSIIKW